MPNNYATLSLAMIQPVCCLQQKMPAHFATLCRLLSTCTIILSSLLINDMLLWLLLVALCLCIALLYVTVCW